MATKWRSVLLGPAILALVLSAGAASPSATAVAATGGTTGGTTGESRSTLRQSPEFLAAKDAGRVRRDATTGAVYVADNPQAPLYPTSIQIDNAWTRKIIEQERESLDDAGTYYYDMNYFNFCAPGATAVMFYYWNTASKQGNFTEPYGPHQTTTHWENQDTDAYEGYISHWRSWIAYFAMKSLPPSKSAPYSGEDEFNHYPTQGAGLDDVRDAINWEISGRNVSNWEEYFYVSEDPADSSALHWRIQDDLYYGVPTYLAVNPYYVMDDGTIYNLPNWSHDLGGSGHAIAVVGYDDSTSKYTYIDTCGINCNHSVGNTNGGTQTVGQYTLWKLMHVYANGGAVW